MDIVEKILPANCIPSPESPEKRIITWPSSSFLFSSAILFLYLAPPSRTFILSGLPLMFMPNLNGIIDFNSKVRVKENMEDYSLDLACHDVDDAKKEVTSVKKLVKRIFDK